MPVCIRFRKNPEAAGILIGSVKVNFHGQIGHFRAGDAYVAKGAYITFPAVRGIQATREYYITMCPLRIIPRIFLFDEKEVGPELRAQRVLNKVRIPAIRNYIVKNPTEYVFSALTASIDADVEFVPVSEDPGYYNVGHIRIPMSARFVINDGQHRRAAIEAALEERPDLGDETIGCVLFVDTGLKRSQQMFSDLNRYAIRPTQSLNILYDSRDPLAQLARDLVRKVPAFDGMTELDKTCISNRSPKIFTLSGIYRATLELLADQSSLEITDRLALAVSYWREVSENIPEWGAVKRGELPADELRKNYIHAHTVALAALGRAGRGLLATRPSDWKDALTSIGRINWHRTNARLWEGRAIVGGKVSIARNNITLLANVIKQSMGLPLDKEEQAAEEAFLRGRN